MYKTKIDPDNIMTSFCIFFKLERGMTFIAICTNINLFSAIWDLYGVPLRWYRDPELFPNIGTLHRDTIILSLIVGWVATVLVPRIYAALKFTSWLFKRNDFQR